MTVLRGHEPRGRYNDYIIALAWNGSCVTSSTKYDKRILHQDIRCRNSVVMEFQGHAKNVCGLKWNQDARSLASGGNDNLVCVFDIAISGLNRLQDGSAAFPQRVAPRLQLKGHEGAIKALDWCPSSPHVLASGGGLLDHTIKLWNCWSGEMVHSVATGTEVTGVKWSQDGNEMCSTHGWGPSQRAACLVGAQTLPAWSYQGPGPHGLIKVQGLGVSMYGSHRAYYLVSEGNRFGWCCLWN